MTQASQDESSREKCAICLDILGGECGSITCSSSACSVAARKAGAEDQASRRQVVKLPCGHRYCAECVLPLAYAGRSCPLCRCHVQWMSVEGLGMRSPSNGLDAQRALLYFASLGDVDGVRSALEQGAEINTRTSNRATPLILAAMHGH